MTKGDSQEWDNLIKWLEEKHPGFERNLSLRDVPGLERGLVTSKKLKKGDILFHIPSSCMLNPLTLLPNSPIPSHLFPQTASKSVPTSSLTPTQKKPRIGNPPRKLDTTQLLTLHLALTKDPKGRYKSDWQVYIDSLPITFRPWHPLTWIVNPSDKTQKEEWEWWNQLYTIGLSESTKMKVQDVKNRFEKDYGLLSDVLKEEEPFKSQGLEGTISKEDILWAWLNVNTRSISIPLGLPGPSERNNHTLVPLMDFINHSSNESLITPKVKQLPTPSSSRTRKVSVTTKTNANGSPAPPLPSKTNGHTDVNNGIRNNAVLLPNKIDFQLSCPDRGLDANDEVLFEYGGHSSSTLFAEYGFCEIPKSPIPQVIPSTDKEKNDSEYDKRFSLVDGVNADEQTIGWLDMKYGEVDLTSYINELWDQQDQEDKEEKKQVLEDIGCWGGNTLHAQPSPCHPSHSLLMIIRLLHLPASSPKLSNISKGLITYISPQNETSTLLTLEGICKKVIMEATKRDKVLKKLVKEEKNNEKVGVIGMLRAMCDEEKVICGEVLTRLEKGDNFQ